MIVALLFAAAQDARVIAVSNSPPPPMIVAVESRPAPVPTPVQSVPVRVRVTAGSRELFDDTLRVSKSASATYTESRSEAPQSVCSTDRYYGSSERYSLNVQLYLREELPTGPAVNVSVNWQRPSNGAACGGEGTRTVQLTQTVPLAAGQSATVRGDAGLTVTVSR